MQNNITLRRVYRHPDTTEIKRIIWGQVSNHEFRAPSTLTHWQAIRDERCAEKKDSTGKTIYEGDILDHPRMGIGVVEYDSMRAAFVAVRANGEQIPLLPTHTITGQRQDF